MDELPRTIGRFRVEALLGRGAMGVVYRAHDPDIDRNVAIKLIRADLLDGDSREQYLQRFRTEARAAGRCVHPNIIGVHDFATHEGNPYLVMEYVEGVDLGRVFTRGTQAPVAAVARIALLVLDALAYAHGFGIVHRDIKPANILLMVAGTPDIGSDKLPMLDIARLNLKVTDFGISRLGSLELTQNAVLVGTPSYMSPEQCRGDPVDGRCDLFSLACVLHELLTGQRLFSGASFAETLYTLTHVAHRPACDVRPDVPAGLSRIIDRALAKRAEERFEGAAAMAAAIRLLHEGEFADRLDSRDDGATIVLPSSRPHQPGPASGTGAADLAHLGGSSLLTIERRLARHIGPLAGYYMRRTLRDARSADEFCRLLGDLLPQESQRGPFIRDALELVADASGSHATPPTLGPASSGETGGAGLMADAVERVTRALAQIMGPIAPRLVAKARAKAGSRSELENLCAEMIEQPEQRMRFRTLLDGT